MDLRKAKLRTSAGQSHWIDEFLMIVDIAFGYLVGICSGAIVGWLFGLCVGNFYVRHWQPVYASAYSALSEISEWTLKPGLMADKGACIGATVGAIIVSAAWIGLWRKRKITAHASRLGVK